jgi:hypothetical protein
VRWTGPTTADDDADADVDDYVGSVPDEPAAEDDPEQDDEEDR